MTHENKQKDFSYSLNDQKENYIAPIERSAKLREYQKGIFDGHKETVDG